MLSNGPHSRVTIQFGPSIIYLTFSGPRIKGRHNLRQDGYSGSTGTARSPQVLLRDMERANTRQLESHIPRPPRTRSKFQQMWKSLP
jgi:hypothetical protein